MQTWISIVLGVFFMLMAFLTKGIRGAFGGGPLRPISVVGRIVFFLAGLTIFISSVRLLMGTH